jgi:hypothetical protein
VVQQVAKVMSELSQLAVELGDFCAKRGWRFCVIGGFAVQHWGEPRMTMDVDLSFLERFGEEEVLVDELLRHYAGHLLDARNFALRRLSTSFQGAVFSKFQIQNPTLKILRQMNAGPGAAKNRGRLARTN